MVPAAVGGSPPEIRGCAKVGGSQYFAEPDLRVEIACRIETYDLFHLEAISSMKSCDIRFLVIYLKIQWLHAGPENPAKVFRYPIMVLSQRLFLK